MTEQGENRAGLSPSQEIKGNKERGIRDLARRVGPGDSMRKQHEKVSQRFWLGDSKINLEN